VFSNTAVKVTTSENTRPAFAYLWIISLLIDDGDSIYGNYDEPEPETSTGPKKLLFTIAR
jgi:hypothetical protein